MMNVIEEIFEIISLIEILANGIKICTITHKYVLQFTKNYKVSSTLRQ